MTIFFVHRTLRAMFIMLGVTMFPMVAIAASPAPLPSSPGVAACPDVGVATLSDRDHTEIVRAAATHYATLVAMSHHEGAVAPDKAPTGVQVLGVMANALFIPDGTRAKVKCVLELEPKLEAARAKLSPEQRASIAQADESLARAQSPAAMVSAIHTSAMESTGLTRDSLLIGAQHSDAILRSGRNSIYNNDFYPAIFSRPGGGFFQESSGHSFGRPTIDTARLERTDLRGAVEGAVTGCAEGAAGGPGGCAAGALKGLVVDATVESAGDVMAQLWEQTHKKKP